VADVRDVFVQELLQAAKKEERICAVINDSLSASRLAPFAALYPERTFNVGIAEQNLVGFAAGLAATGMLPWLSSATCFLSYRALEQIKNDIVYSGHNVKLVGNTTGLDYGALGATHHSLEDLGVLRALPHFPIVIPADHKETAEAVRVLLSYDGPAHLRLYRCQVPEDLGMPGEFELGKVRLLREGADCTIFACGAMVVRALEAAEILAKQGIEAGVVNVSTLSPLDVEGVVQAAAASGATITVEEHSIHGGLGDAVASAISAHKPRRVLKIGLTEFSVGGTPEQLRQRYGLTAQGIAKRTGDFLMVTS
jgi:transketolase